MGKGDPDRLRIVAAFISPELFGHERGNLEVLKALRNCGAEVSIGLNEGERDGALAVEVTRLGFDSFAVPFGVRWSKGLFREQPKLMFKNFVQLARSNRRFAKQLREFGATHVHVGSPLVYSFISRAIRRCGVPYVIRMGDAPPTASPVQMMIWRRFINGSRVTVANSRYVWNTSAAASPALARRKPIIIHNVAPVAMQDAAQAPFDLGLRHVVYVGQTTRDKGILEVVGAAGLLLPKRPDLRFHIVGGSRYNAATEEEVRRRIEALGISNACTFHGWVNNARSFFARADVHVAPSMWEEPFANVVLEAKREGTPSVVFPSGGLPEMINHQRDGFICAERTPEALAHGIEWILERPRDEARRLRENAARDYKERFAEERFRTAWLEVYRQAANVL